MEATCQINLTNEKSVESSPSADAKERQHKQENNFNHPNVTQADAGDTSIESDPPKDPKAK